MPVECAPPSQCAYSEQTSTSASETASLSSSSATIGARFASSDVCIAHLSCCIAWYRDGCESILSTTSLITSTRAHCTASLSERETGSDVPVVRDAVSGAGDCGEAAEIEAGEQPKEAPWPSCSASYCCSTACSKAFSSSSSPARDTRTHADAHTQRWRTSPHRPLTPSPVTTQHAPPRPPPPGRPHSSLRPRHALRPRVRLPTAAATRVHRPRRFRTAHQTARAAAPRR